jgi:hypothetical protein
MQHAATHLAVMASRCWGSSEGRYMIIPTQLNTELSGSFPLVQLLPAAAAGPAAAGLSALLLAAVQRCSMGAGAGMAADSMIRRSSRM